MTLVGMSASRIAERHCVRPIRKSTYRLRDYARFGFWQSSDFLPSLLT